MRYRIRPAIGTKSLDEESVALTDIRRKIYESPEKLAAEFKLSVDDSLAVARLAIGATVKVMLTLDRIQRITGTRFLEAFVSRLE